MLITWRANSDNTTLVTDDVKLLDIKKCPPPEGLKCILANRQAGTSTTGVWEKDDTFYTHWFPFPTFEKGERRTEKFQWKDAKDNFHDPAEMTTEHLFYTVRTIWNSHVPEHLRVPGNIYVFSGFYTPEYLATAIKVLSEELSKRNDLPLEYQEQLDIIRNLRTAAEL